MRKPVTLARAVALGLLVISGAFTVADQSHGDSINVALGPRPFYLVNKLQAGPLKTLLQDCATQKNSYKTSSFSIGHRGAPLQFPEHTRESYIAAARMGAGTVECDVTFTKDRVLVCRHAQCDLHSTTNIVTTDLAQKCSVPPIVDKQGKLTNAAEIRCCASDLTLSEFKSLAGKMDAVNLAATTLREYVQATPTFRTDLYSGGGSWDSPDPCRERCTIRVAGCGHDTRT